MRIAELIQGADGKLDEQPLILMAAAAVFLGLSIHKFWGDPSAFSPLEFAGACAAFATGSLGSLTMRSRFSRDDPSANANSAP